MARPNFRRIVRPRRNLFKVKFLLSRYNFGSLDSLPPQQVRSIIGLSKPSYYYWKKKLQVDGPQNSWGGSRRSMFASEVSRRMFHFAIWDLMMTVAGITLIKVKEHFDQRNIKVRIGYYSELMKKWRWSHHIPAILQRQKYTRENIEYYNTYLSATYFIDPGCLKFLDEANYNIKDLRKNRVYAPAGEQPVVIDSQKLTDSHSTIVLTSINPNQDPVYFKILEPGVTNTSLTVLEFICDLISQRVLLPDDVLVMDNARVHSSIMPDILEVTGAANVQIRFLPTYSPELNPCEQCHNQAKKFIRFRRGDMGFGPSIYAGHFAINRDFVVKSYKQCITSIFDYS